MPEQFRGMARIERLLADHVFPDTIEPQYLPAHPVPEWAMTSQSEVVVECTAALIEELHDALNEFRHPAFVIQGPDPP